MGRNNQNIVLTRIDLEILSLLVNDSQITKQEIYNFFEKKFKKKSNRVKDRIESLKKNYLISEYKGERAFKFKILKKDFVDDLLSELFTFLPPIPELPPIHPVRSSHGKK